MSLKLNRTAYQKLIDEDVAAVLASNTEALDREHIVDVLRHSVEMYYPKSATDYPSWESYQAGGSILNGWTTLRNVVSECQECGLTERDIENVWNIIKRGGEVIIQGGQIRAAR